MDFFVTCGSGLEPFAIKELQYKFDINTSSIKENEFWNVFPGKLFFKTKESFSLKPIKDAMIVQDLISGLKTVERLMSIVLVDTASVHVKNKRDLLSALYEMASRPHTKELLNRWAAIKEIHRKELRHSSPTPETGKPEDDLPPEKKSRIADDTEPVEFRVNVKLTGGFRKVCSLWEASKSIGSAILKSMSGDDKWNINLRHPNLEVSIFVTDNGIIFAVPMTVKPISERSYLTHCPLRSTVAYAMASLVFDENEDLDLESNPVCVLDPMCGTGTILVEVAHNFRADIICGIDNDPEQISKCVENVTNANVQNQVLLFRSDSTKSIPLLIKFDAIICDLPFGRQHGTRQGILADLPKVLNVMNDCLKQKGRLVLLISSEMASNLEACATNISGFSLISKYPVKLGELQAVMFSFQK